MQFIINVFRIAISLLFLGYASWSDIKTREVDNKVWLLYAPLGLMLTLFEELEKEPFWKKLLTVLCGYKVSIEKLKEKDFYFPLEDVKENKDGVERFIVVFPGDKERSGILARLEDYIEKGMVDRYIWASPGLPMLVFITLGFIVALFFGDLVWLLVDSLFFSLKL